MADENTTESASDCERVQEINEYPHWLTSLFEFFEFNGSEVRKEKNDNKTRERTYFTMTCMLCKEAKTTRSQPPQKRKKVPSKDVIIGKNAWPFQRHLQRNHGDHPRKDMFAASTISKRRFGDGEVDKEPSILPSVIGVSLKPRFKEVQKYDPDSVKQQTINQKVLDLIVEDGLPFRVVEGVGLKAFASYLDPRAHIPSRPTVMRLLDKKYAEVQCYFENAIHKHLRTSLKEVDLQSAHLMMDIWSSRQKLSVIGLQVRVIKDWKVRQFVLGFKHFPGKHDAESIRNKIQHILINDFGLDMKKFCTVTADNASAVLSAFKDISSTGSGSLQAHESASSNTAAIPSTTTAQCNELVTIINEDETEELLDPEEIFERNFNADDEFDNIMDTVISQWASNEYIQLHRNSCMAHLLQLALKDALSNRTVSQLLRKVNTIVTWFHKSNKYYTKLRELTNLGLVKPVETRWNSSYYCLERLCQVVTITTEDHIRKELMMQVVNEVLQDGKKALKEKVPSLLSLHDFKCIAVLVKILKPFADLTDMWQGDNITSSTVIVGFVDTIHKLDEVQLNLSDDIEMDDENLQTLEGRLTEFKAQLRESVFNRFTTEPSARKKSVARERKIVTTDVMNSRFYILATVLDPRAKLLPFEGNVSADIDESCKNGYPSKERILEILEEAYNVEKKQLETREVEIIENNASDSFSPQANASQSSDGSGHSGQLPQSSKPSEQVSKPTCKLSVFGRLHQQATSSSSRRIDDEIESYLKSSTIGENDHPLRFWRANENRYPILSSLAKKYLGMPATSASVERLFSVAGSIISSRRASMKLETAEKMIMYKEYLRKGYL